MRSTGTTKGATRGPHGAMKGRQLIRNLETTNTKLMRNTGTMKGATRGATRGNEEGCRFTPNYL